MSQKYADIIIDISHEGVDRPFQYIIPEELETEVGVGSKVTVPFGQGNRRRTGYVVRITEEPSWDVDKLKYVTGVEEGYIAVESKLIRLAAWMRREYGSTMIAALKTVMPVKKKVRERKTQISTNEYIPDFEKISNLSDDQQAVFEDFKTDWDAGDRNTYLLHGITGSGKTEVYIAMADHVISQGRDVIILVPEIALTYQTVARFKTHFQDSISILNSRLSDGEKYREFMKCREGKTHIIIGPRSALFAPFENLGLIVIDEEHDMAYKSEMTPKYHAREVAIERARMDGASVVLGSATPAISTYYKALNGEYKLYTLDSRVAGATLPDVHIVDLRDELAKGNRSIISRKLYDSMDAAFKSGEQVMLFINRRGYNSFVSCRSCGEVIRCPRCDVSLSLHETYNSRKLICHYCGHTENSPTECPKCHSKLIGGYGTGTQKLEEEVKKLFPSIRTLRMDKDTTTAKGAHGAIISKFRNHEADCLIGTQMIVKGHDFGNVSVVGNVLADLSLFDNDFESAERTFDLLTQASGRAGRTGDSRGTVVIQTYQPEHYAIETAAAQNYRSFYDYEMAYRRILHYPPVYELLCVLVTSAKEDNAVKVADALAEAAKAYVQDAKVASDTKGVRGCETDVIGPAEAYIYRINDIYRRVIYIKSAEHDKLIGISEHIQEVFSTFDENDVEVSFDFNPMNVM